MSKLRRPDIEQQAEKALGLPVLGAFSRADWPTGAEVWLDKLNAVWFDGTVQGYVVRRGRPTDFQPTEYHRIVAERPMPEGHAYACPLVLDGLR